MAIIHLDCPDELVSKIDAIVHERRKLPKYRELTAEEVRTAKRISREQDTNAANAYIRSLQLSQRHSRTSVTLEILIPAVENYKITRAPEVTPTGVKKYNVA